MTEGRVAIVTGAGASGEVTNIGQAVARTLARGGAKVAVNDLSASAAEATVARCEGEAAAFVGDVTDEAACERLVAAVHERWGRLDVLINNVGVVSRESVATLSDDALALGLRQNFTSAFLMSKHALPRMAPGGSIVHLSSTAAVWPSHDTAYSIGKAALEALSRALAVQYGDAQIRSNVVRPGFVWTEMAARQYPDEPRRTRVREAQRSVSALQTVGTAWDVAEAVAFFAGDSSRWISGQVLTIDGGAAYRRPDFDASRGFDEEFRAIQRVLMEDA